MTQHQSDFIGHRNGHGDIHPAQLADTARSSQSGDDGQDGADGATDPSVYDLVVGAVERNPILALGAVAALGAITVMALYPRRPESNLQALERQARRRAGELERSLKSGLDNSGLSRGFDDLSGALAQRLASADFSALEPIGRRASTLLDRAMERVSAAVK